MTVTGIDTTKRVRGVSCFLILLATLPAAGCGDDGPELGLVSGTVTLDGEPVPNAYITFTPEGAGRPAMAKSDTGGHYELRFNPSRKGALVGPHQVRVSTEDITKDDKRIPEIIPEKYNLKGSIPVTIEPGKNKIDLELASDSRN